MPSTIGVSTPPDSEESQFGKELLYSANESGQITVLGDFMRIGIGGIRIGEYTESEGRTQTGPVAHLSFFVRGRPELEEEIDIHEGQVMVVAGYRIRVVEINEAQRIVVVRIAPPVQ